MAVRQWWWQRGGGGDGSARHGNSGGSAAAAATARQHGGMAAAASMAEVSVAAVVEAAVVAEAGCSGQLGNATAAQHHLQQHRAPRTGFHSSWSTFLRYCNISKKGVDYRTLQ